MMLCEIVQYDDMVINIPIIPLNAIDFCLLMTSCDCNITASRLL